MSPQPVVPHRPRWRKKVRGFYVRHLRDRARTPIGRQRLRLAWWQQHGLPGQSIGHFVKHDVGSGFLTLARARQPCEADGLSFVGIGHVKETDDLTGTNIKRVGRLLRPVGGWGEDGGVGGARISSASDHASSDSSFTFASARSVSSASAVKLR